MIRRSDVVGIYLNHAATRRLVGAVLPEQQTNGPKAVRYLTDGVDINTQTVPATDSWTPQPEQPSTSRQDRLSQSPGREEKLAGGVPTSRGCSWPCSPRLEAACPGQGHG